MKKQLFFSSFFVFLLPATIFAATLSLSPTSGTFTVGSTFDVSIIIDTQGKSVNAISASIQFPADKLQIVTPSSGRSIVDVWTAPPKYNNLTGNIFIEGAISKGLNTTSGVVASFTFRVKSVGESIVKFLDDSKVLLNDGHATDDLKNTQNAFYKLILPPPAGPIVYSTSHPNQNNWYKSKDVILEWSSLDEKSEGYSYSLSNDAGEEPDNIIDGKKNSVIYKNLDDGVYYFHIKSLRAGVWGGVTDFGIKIDSTPPAEFPIIIWPGERTSSKSVIATFKTTDEQSGVDYYEYSVVSLNPDITENGDNKNSKFFTETTSPLNLQLEKGSYDLTIKAYDKTGNARKVVQRISITSAIFQFVGLSGLYLRGAGIISWVWVFIVIGIIISLLFYGAYEARKYNKHFHLMHKNKNLPDKISKELEELKKYREKYGKKIISILLILSSFFFAHKNVNAESSFPPPIIDSYSRYLSNEEVFYADGKSERPNEEIIIYVENLSTREITTRNISSNNNSEWLYKENKPLDSGNYIIWVQAKRDAELSAPSPQIQIEVKKQAIQIGFNRISIEMLYLVFLIIAIITAIILAIFIIFHYSIGKKKRNEFLNHIKHAEDSIIRGFAILKKDIEAELSVIHKARLSSELSVEEKIREQELVEDLGSVQKRLTKEIWEIEQESKKIS